MSDVPGSQHRTAIFLYGALGIGLCAIIPLIAFADRNIVPISQKYRAFHPKEITIHQGDVLHIMNDDEFTHQVYVDNNGFSFESPEHAPGEAIDLSFPGPGTYTVLCHIHPKMKLDVTVK